MRSSSLSGVWGEAPATETFYCIFAMKLHLVKTICFRFEVMSVIYATKQKCAR